VGSEMLPSRFEQTSRSPERARSGRTPGPPRRVQIGEAASRFYAVSNRPTAVHYRRISRGFRRRFDGEHTRASTPWGVSPTFETASYKKLPHTSFSLAPSLESALYGSGDQLQRPLVPKGIDPRIIEDTIDYWSE